MNSGKFAANFATAKKLNIAETWLTWISAVLMILEVILKNYSIDDIIQSVVISNCIIIVVFQLLTFIREIIQFIAEEHKRLDLFDNSFGTMLSEHRSVGYYSNDTIKAGITKLGVNNFESSFFTYRILEADFKYELLKAIIVLGVFVVAAICGLQIIIVLLIQITLPITIIVEGLRFGLTKYRVGSIYREYRKLFEKSSNIREADILNLVVSYTATIQSGHVLLSDKTYNHLNDPLSKEWQLIKKELNITE